MTAAEKAELEHLTNLWNCSEPMTDEQIRRMEELTERANG